MALKNVSSLMSEELTGHTLDLIRVSEDVLRKGILGSLKKLEQSLISKIEKIGIASTDAQIARLARLEKLHDATARSIKSAYSANRNLLHDELTDLAKLEANVYAPKLLNDALGVELATATVPVQVMKQLAKGALIQGAPSAEWWGRQAKSLQDSFQDQMTQGILAGESTNALVQRVRGTATGKFQSYTFEGKTRKFREFKGGLMDASTREATALVRTSVMNVSNTARLESYKENSDIIKAIQALVTLDGVTTPLCQSRSGMVWDLETGEGISGGAGNFPGTPPWHWQCRSTLTPVTKSWNELQEEAHGKVKKKVEEIPKTTQSSMDGQVSADLNYEQWLETKSTSVQKGILGPSKYKMFKKGDLKLTDLVSAQTGRPLSVAQLKLKLEPGASVKTISVPPKLRKFKAKGGNTLQDQADNIVDDIQVEKLSNRMLQMEMNTDGLDPTQFGSIKGFYSSGRKNLAKAFSEADKEVAAFLEELGLTEVSLVSMTEQEAANILAQLSDAWATSTTSSRSLFLQQAVKQEFGLASSTTTVLEMTPEWKKMSMAMKDAKIAAGAKKVVRIMYEDTQAYLKANGITEVYAYRGSRFNRLPTTLQKLADSKGGLHRQPSALLEVTQQPIASWTLEINTAEIFTEGAASMLQGSIVPSKRIFSTALNGIGNAGEAELVLLGGTDSTSVVLFDKAIEFDADEILLKLLEAN